MPPPIVTTMPGAPRARAMIAPIRRVQVIASAIARTRYRRSGVRNTGLLGWGLFQGIGGSYERNKAGHDRVSESMTVDADALARVLATVDLRVGFARRVPI